MKRHHRASRRTDHRHKWSIHRQELLDNKWEKELVFLSLWELLAEPWAVRFRMELRAVRFGRDLLSEQLVLQLVSELSAMQLLERWFR